jgi:hypothetical protein
MKKGGIMDTLATILVALSFIGYHLIKANDILEIKTVVIIVLLIATGWFLRKAFTSS